MSELPYPWNPKGAMLPSVAHLFTPKKERHERPPGSQPSPGPACQFTIGKPGDAQVTSKLKKAKI